MDRILNTLNMLNVTDYIVVGIYFVLVFIIAFYSGSKKSENGEAADYFLGGRRTDLGRVFTATVSLAGAVSLSK